MTKKMRISIGILLATVVLWGLIDFYYTSPHSIDSYFRALVVGSIAFLLSLLVDVEGLHHQAKKSSESIETLINQAKRLGMEVRALILGETGVKISRFVEQNQNTLGQFLERWVDATLVKELSNERKSFKVTQQPLVLRSYEIFWDILVEEQKKRAHRGEKSLDVLVTHSTSWEAWTDGKQFLAKQKEFCENHGKITRILCGNGEEPNPTILKIAKSMGTRSIHVLYYNRDSSEAMINFDFSWDFLYVKETHVAVIWSSGQNSDISDSTYQIGDNFGNKKLEELWHNIEKGVSARYRHATEWWNS